MFTDVLSNSIRDVSEIELDWLKEIAHHYYDFGLDAREQREYEANYEAGNVANFN
jgi:hypothetical protein